MPIGRPLRARPDPALAWHSESHRARMLPCVAGPRLRATLPRPRRQGTLVEAGGRAWQLLKAGGRQLLDALRATGTLPDINHVRPARPSAHARGIACCAETGQRPRARRTSSK